MPTFLSRTLLALEECEQHLANTGATGTLVESYLTQHILVIMCAEMQQEIYGIVNQRAAKNTDLQLTRFVSSAQKKMLRSVMTSEVAGFLAHFQVEYKEEINKSLSEQEVTIYNNAVIDRHDVAHKQGANVSFDELKKACSVAIKILETVNITLNPP